MPDVEAGSENNGAGDLSSLVAGGPSYATAAR
jgi:hypothetical protein